MSTTAQKVLWELSSGEVLSIGEIATEIGTSDATIRAVIKIHVEDGLLEPLGITSGGARCYGLTHKGKEWLQARL